MASCYTNLPKEDAPGYVYDELSVFIKDHNITTVEQFLEDKELQVLGIYKLATMIEMFIESDKND